VDETSQLASIEEPQPGATVPHRVSHAQQPRELTPSSEIHMSFAGAPGKGYWAGGSECAVCTCSVRTYRSTPRRAVAPASVHKVWCVIYVMARVTGTKRRPRTVSDTPHPTNDTAQLLPTGRCPAHSLRVWEAFICARPSEWTPALRHSLSTTPHDSLIRLYVLHSGAKV